VLWALAEPAAFAGLLVAFALGLLIRTTTQRALRRWVLGERRLPVMPRLRYDVDPFGAVAAALGGTGWGKAAELPTPGGFGYGGIHVGAARFGRAWRALTLAGGPLAVLVAGWAVLALHRVWYPDSFLIVFSRPVDVLRGVPGQAGEQFLLSAGVGLLCFGVLALIPLPPLDGWGLLWLALRRPGPGAQRARYWLEDHNLGVVILLACALLPPGARPILLVVLDYLVWPLTGPFR